MSAFHTFLNAVSDLAEMRVLNNTRDLVPQLKARSPPPPTPPSPPQQASETNSKVPMDATGHLSAVA